MLKRAKTSKNRIVLFWVFIGFISSGFLVTFFGEYFLTVLQWKLNFF